MRSKMHVAVLMALAIATVFAISNQSSALAFTDAITEIGETTTLHVEPDVYDQNGTAGVDLFVVGNATNECNQLGYDYGFKQDDPFTGNGVGIGDGMLINYEFDNGNQGTYLDWSSELGVDAVILKASTKANVYAYDGEANGDTGLRTPWRTTRRGDLKYYGISHVTFCWDRELLVEKTADVEYTREYDWTIEKSVIPEEHHLFVGDSGTSSYTVTALKDDGTDKDFAVSGSISVSNPWVATAGNVSVTDILDLNVDCGSFVGTLEFGDSVECSYYAFFGLAGSLPTTNTATATADGFNDQSVTVDIVLGEPSSFENDTATVSDTNGAGPANNVNDDEIWTYPVEFGTDGCDANSGEAHMVGNTATITESDSGDSVSANADVDIYCYAPTIGKSVRSTDFTRTFDWTITKDVDVDEHNLITDGDPAASVYTVKMTKNEGTDSDHLTTGTIEIYNPHPSETLSATLVDGAASYLETTVISVAPGGSQSIDWESNDSNATSNTASFDLLGSGYSDTVNYSYGTPGTVVNDSAVVNDNNTAFGGTRSISVTTTWNYNVSFECGADEGVNPNTASFTSDADSGSASASVLVNCEDADNGGGGGHETAFMVGEFSFCDTAGDGTLPGFNADDIHRWGWAEQIDDGHTTYEVYAGAGQCDTGKGTKVGSVTIIADGFLPGFGLTQVFVDMENGWEMLELHINVSDDIAWIDDASDVAPGGYNMNGLVLLTPSHGELFVPEDLTGDWIIVHAAVVPSS